MSKMYAIRTMAPDLGKLNSTANSQHSEQSARQSETSTFAIFLRFVRIGMTQSTEGKLLGKSNNQKDAWGTGSQNRSMEFDDSNVQPHGSQSWDNCIAGNKQDLALYLKLQYKQNLKDRQKEKDTQTCMHDMGEGRRHCQKEYPEK
nr:uncharacterized protein LOC105489309 isoform X1 [Macaca nemestrina]